jgi:RNA polymerase sigma-70 factor, ECF subfamily
MENAALSCYIDGLFRYAVTLTRNPGDAGDLVQETYVRAFKAKHSLRTSSNVRGWLFTILRNIWINQLRQKRTSLKFVDFADGESIVDVAVDDSLDPLETYATEQERRRVREAIQQLPAESREIILLREYEELSYREIACVLKCPAGTVMSRLARARSKLRALL